MGADLHQVLELARFAPRAAERGQECSSRVELPDHVVAVVEDEHVTLTIDREIAGGREAGGSTDREREARS